MTRIRQEIQLCDYYKLNAIVVEAKCDEGVFNFAEVVYSTLPETTCKVIKYNVNNFCRVSFEACVRKCRCWCECR